MPTTDAKSVVQRYWDDGVPRAMKGETGALDAYLSDHFVQHSSAFNRHGKGKKDDHHNVIAETAKIIPDLEAKLQGLIADGDTVAARWRLRGKHGGHMKHKHHDEHVAPTGADLEVNGITIYRVENGKIVESWSHDDHLDALIAAGALKVGP